MISRRALTRTAVAAALLPSSLIRANRAQAALDFDDPADVTTALVKLRGSLESELVIWYLKGTVYGVVDQQARRLWGLHSVNFNHFRRRSESRYAMTGVEFNYPCDLESGDHIKTFDNPYTDQRIELGYRPFGPNTLILTKRGFELPPDRAEFRSATLETALGPVHVHENDAWLFEDVYAEVPSMGADGRAWYANDITTYKGRLDHLNDGGVSSVPATLSFQSVVSWHAWMNMGDRPGHMMSRLAGKKLFSRDALPPWFTAVAEREHPRMIRDVEKLIGL